MYKLTKTGNLIESFSCSDLSRAGRNICHVTVRPLSDLSPLLTGSCISSLRCIKTRWRSWGKSLRRLRQRGPSLLLVVSAIRPSLLMAAAEPAATVRAASVPAVGGVSHWEPIRSVFMCLHVDVNRNIKKQQQIELVSVQSCIHIHIQYLQIFLPKSQTFSAFLSLR